MSKWLVKNEKWKMLLSAVCELATRFPHSSLFPFHSLRNKRWNHRPPRPGVSFAVFVADADKTLLAGIVVSDSSGEFDSIIVNDNLSKGEFGYVIVQDGDYIQLQIS